MIENAKKKISKTIDIKQIQFELYSLYNENGFVWFMYGDSKLQIKTMSLEGDMVRINGSLYYFGNTYKDTRKCKKITNKSDLVDLCDEVSKRLDTILEKRKLDIVYLSLWDLVNDGSMVRKILTAEHTDTPNFIVESYDKSEFEVDIDVSESTISIKKHIRVVEIDSIDVRELFEMEYLNSLFIVKVSHGRHLDIESIIKVLKKLESKKVVHIVSMSNSRSFVTVYLYIPLDLIRYVFGQTLTKRVADVRLIDFGTVLSGS